MTLTDRQVAFLSVMQDGREYGPGQIYRLAFPDAERRMREDAGATRTLDTLQDRGLVRGRYLPWSSAQGRQWRIMQEGKDELAARGLLRKPKRVGLAQRINGIPERDGYIYGLAVRDGEMLDVAVCKLIDGRTGDVVGRVTGRGWSGPDGVHAAARALIDRVGA